MTDAPALCSLEDEGKALVARLGGRWSGHGGLCRCPAHDDHNPSLSVRVGQRSLLFHCFAGCETVAVLKGLRAAGHPLGTRAAAAAAPAGSDDDRGWRAARRLWREARAIAGTPADRYLARRGLSTGSTELRYHWRTPDGPSPLTRFRPALVAAVRDETGLVAVHRSFLDPDRDRLAAIDDPRRGLGRFGRGAVRLGGVAPCLGLAAGLETALSATALVGLPCWATLGTERFRLVSLPPQVTRLVLFLDNDRGGRRAEALAREAFAYLAVEVRYPRRRGTDWNDVLCAGSAPSPDRRSIRPARVDSLNPSRRRG